MSGSACNIILLSGKQYGITLDAAEVARRTNEDPSGVSQMPQRGSSLSLWVRHDAIVAIEEAPTRASASWS